MTFQEIVMRECRHKAGKQVRAFDFETSVEKFGDHGCSAGFWVCPSVDAAGIGTAVVGDSEITRRCYG